MTTNTKTNISKRFIAVLFAGTSIASLSAFAGVNADEPPSPSEVWQLVQQQQQQISSLQAIIEKLQADQSLQLVQETPARAQKVKGPDAHQGTADVPGWQTTGGYSVEVGGFIRADYSVGDRHGDTQGDDSLGVSRAALATKFHKDNITGVLVLGTGNTTDLGGSFRGDVVLADAYVVWDRIAGSKFSLSAGAQPLLFGLKPNGFPVDRSLQGSLEYGAAGAFAVSNQLGPSIIGTYAFSDQWSLRAGLFDQRDGDDALGVGSDLSDNYFFQLRGTGLFETGLYGSIGYEKRYVATTGNAEPVIDIGIGYQNDTFDVSFEYISIDRALAQTLEDETFLIAETTWNATDTTSAYFDFARATEADINTYRIGMWRDISSIFRVTGEFALDKIRGNNAQSVDLHLTVSY